jgi:hypothetical protein
LEVITEDYRTIVISRSGSSSPVVGLGATLAASKGGALVVKWVNIVG